MRVFITTSQMHLCYCQYYSGNAFEAVVVTARVIVLLTIR